MTDRNVGPGVDVNDTFYPDPPAPAQPAITISPSGVFTQTTTVPPGAALPRPDAADRRKVVTADA